MKSTTFIANVIVAVSMPLGLKKYWLGTGQEGDATAFMVDKDIIDYSHIVTVMKLDIA